MTQSDGETPEKDNTRSPAYWSMLAGNTKGNLTAPKPFHIRLPWTTIRSFPLRPGMASPVSTMAPRTGRQRGAFRKIKRGLSPALLECAFVGDGPNPNQNWVFGDKGGLRNHAIDHLPTRDRLSWIPHFPQRAFWDPVG